MTLGEDRVKIDFNPAGNALVAELKAKVAALIDLCEREKVHGGTEEVRHWALAQTCFEDGCHWALRGVGGKSAGRK